VQDHGEGWERAVAAAAVDFDACDGFRWRLDRTRVNDQKIKQKGRFIYSSMEEQLHFPKEKRKTSQ
jgi:hypothetical protein